MVWSGNYFGIMRNRINRSGMTVEEALELGGKKCQR